MGLAQQEVHHLKSIRVNLVETSFPPDLDMDSTWCTSWEPEHDLTTCYTAGLLN